MMLPLSLLYLFLLPSLSQASFILQVATDDELCFVVRVPPNSLLSGNFDVLDDNLSPDPVTVKLLDHDYNVLYASRKGVSEDIFRVVAEGRLNLCVQNGLTHASRDKLDRSVGVSLQVSPLFLSNSTNSLLGAAQMFHNKVWDLQTHHDYMRNREAAHRQVTEQTFTYVVWWTIAEFVALVVIALAQVWVLRMFFERKRYI
jgi:p24 family protein beta-1